MSRPPLSMSPVASAFASITGSCSCGTMTVVTSRTRSVHAASAPSSVSALRIVERHPLAPAQRRERPVSTGSAHAFNVAASRSGSITGRVIPIRTSAILARRADRARKTTATGVSAPDPWTGVNPRQSLGKTLCRRRALVHRLECMAAVTDFDAVTDPDPAVVPEPADVPQPHTRAIGLVPSASMITGGADRRRCGSGFR